MLVVAIIAILCVWAVLPGCSSSPQREGVHPDFDRLPPDSALAYNLDISKRSAAPLPHFFHPDSLQLIATIGADSTLANEYHERPVTIDIDPEGRIYIVQLRTNSIRVYDKRGAFLYSIGRGGRGPGEFLAIGEFLFSEDYSRLYVLDILEVEIFALTGRGRYEYLTTRPHGFLRVYDMCLLDDTLFMGGYAIVSEDTVEEGTTRRDRAIVTPPITRVHWETLEHIRSFGYEYISYSGRPKYNGLLSATVLSCNEYTGTVVGYLKRYPYLFGYDADGQQKWVSKMDGYLSTRSEEIRTPEGTVAFYPYMNKEIFNWKYPVQKIDNRQYALLQFSYAPLTEYYASLAGRRIKNPVRTVLVDTQTGELFYSDIYDYIGVWKDEIIITMAIDPETFQKTFYVYACH